MRFEAYVRLLLTPIIPVVATREHSRALNRSMDYRGIRSNGFGTVCQWC